MKFRIAVILIISAASFVLFLGQRRYYDYADADCSKESPAIDASLIGTFSSERPRERGNPYYLRVQISPEGKIDSLEISSINFRRTLKSSEILKEKTRNPINSQESVVYLVDSIELPYEDIYMSGQIIRDNISGKKGIPFACKFQKNYKTEWRFSLFDVLMSV